MNRPNYLVATFFLLLVNLVQGQDILILSHKKRNKQILIKSGEQIRFRLKDEKHFNVERITSLEDGLIFLETTIIKIDEIKSIDIRDRKKTAFDVGSYSIVLPIAGIAYMTIDQFNQVVIDDRKFGVSDNVIKVSGAMIIAGILLKLTRTKYYKPSKKKKIRVLKFSP